MNQRADSLKKNLQPAAMKPLICQQGCFLSHTVRCDTTGRGVFATA
jgi:hypothetical protein